MPLDFVWHAVSVFCKKTEDIQKALFKSTAEKQLPEYVFNIVSNILSESNKYDFVEKRGKYSLISVIFFKGVPIQSTESGYSWEIFLPILQEDVHRFLFPSVISSVCSLRRKFAHVEQFSPF